MKKLEENKEQEQPQEQPQPQERGLTVNEAVDHIGTVLEKANRSGALSLTEAAATIQIWNTLKKLIKE